MRKKANLEGYYTNHSLRATTCILAKGAPEKLVMKQTGHRNVKSLQNIQELEYPRVSSKERMRLCPMFCTFLRNRFWRRIRVSLRVRKLLSIVVARILHLVPRLHLLTAKLH